MTSKPLTIDKSNSQVLFKVKKLGFLAIKGSMTDFTGEVVFDKSAAEGHFNVHVSPSTIDTGNEKRDEHLKSKDFFFVSEHPAIQFQSSSIKGNNKSFTVSGSLKILGVSKNVVIPFTFSNGLFEGHFSINRLDFNLGKKFPAFFVGKNVDIEIKCKTQN